MKWNNVPKLDEGLNTLLLKRKELSTIVKNCESTIKEINNKVLYYMRDSERASTEDFNISIVKFTKKVFDTKKFETEQGDLFNQYQKDSEVSYPKITERKKND
ncbi:MAG: hypothetical protein EOM67_13335 [Spirochaetia bacterium]|nr:hypothetical protein [Spirochaetia bacterium]